MINDMLKGLLFTVLLFMNLSSLFYVHDIKELLMDNLLGRCSYMEITADGQEISNEERTKKVR